jgi:hypothetical protein
VNGEARDGVDAGDVAVDGLDGPTVPVVLGDVPVVVRRRVWCAEVIGLRHLTGWSGCRCPGVRDDLVPDVRPHGRTRVRARSFGPREADRVAEPRP